jgi:hypothetical protein
VEDPVGAGRQCVQIVGQDTGEVEIVTQPGHSLAADGAKRVDDEGEVIATTQRKQTAARIGLGERGGGGEEVAPDARPVKVGGDNSVDAEAGLGLDVVADGAGEIPEAALGKAKLLGPMAIAMSPMADSAVALPPPLKMSTPSMEMSITVVAEAVPGVAATAAPIPSPTANMASRPI